MAGRLLSGIRWELQGRGCDYDFERATAEWIAVWAGDGVHRRRARNRDDCRGAQELATPENLTRRRRGRKESAEKSTKRRVSARLWIRLRQGIASAETTSSEETNGDSKGGSRGCGLMGSGIAQVAAASGFNTVVREVSAELLDKGLKSVDKNLNRLAEKGMITEA